VGKTYRHRNSLESLFTHSEQRFGLRFLEGQCSIDPKLLQKLGCRLMIDVCLAWSCELSIKRMINPVSK
jgi:hypothetical protein